MENKVQEVRREVIWIFRILIGLLVITSFYSSYSWNKERLELITADEKIESQRAELIGAREELRILEVMYDRGTDRRTKLEEKLEAATTQRHREAIRLATFRRQVCEKIISADLRKGGKDYDCSEGNRGLPTHEELLELLRDPEEMIHKATTYILEKCPVVPEGQQPTICTDFENATPEEPHFSIVSVPN